MKKIFLLFSIFYLVSCSDTAIVNDCFNNVDVSGTINISNPEFSLLGNNLNVPAGSAKTNLDGRRILIINGISSFKAYDLECPEKDCTSEMTFDGLKLICPCSEKEYNSLNGSPIDGEGCFALEYNVLQTSSSTLQISK